MVLTKEERRVRKNEGNKKYKLTFKGKLTGKKWRIKNKEKIQKYRKEITTPKIKKLAIEVFSVYSKRHSNSNIPCCRCCGINEYMEFLTVDHIYGRDNLPEDEKDLHGKGLNWWLKKNNYPDGFQILCFNCNMAKGDKGHCPHLDIMK